jgi:hypothetical protein
MFGLFASEDTATAANPGQNNTSTVKSQEANDLKDIFFGTFICKKAVNPSNCHFNRHFTKFITYQLKYAYVCIETQENLNNNLCSKLSSLSFVISTVLQMCASVTYQLCIHTTFENDPEMESLST